jgi:hypothetical protein
MNANYLRSMGVATIIGGEFEQRLADLAEGLSASQIRTTGPQQGPVTSVERLSFEVPDRTDLPRMEKYAHLILPGKGFRVVGSTEASRGCKHLCRHCPVVPVYKGVFRVVSREVVMEDVRRQVYAGAQHISFGDPDFFNGIGHALKIIEEFHREFPDVSYDATIKIEHLRKYEEFLPTLRDTGCLFVISAVESVDDHVLAKLNKGHTREDFLQVVRVFRDLGMTLHPTFVPFSPWTTLESYIDLLSVLDGEELAENVAPIQLGIRLLIPEGSLLLELDEIRNLVEPFDAQALFYPWKNKNRRVDELSAEVQAIAADGEEKKESRSQSFERIWKAAHAAVGRVASPLRSGARSTPVPFLSEPWYCCAEPTTAQLVSIGTVSKNSIEPAKISADGFV